MAEKKTPDTVPVFNANDGIINRNNGGPYLDEELAREAEIQNARREGRKPNLDLDNLKKVSHPGINLVTEEELRRISSAANAVSVEDISSKAYGEIPNPVKIEEERRAERAETLQKRAENQQPADEKKEETK